MHLGMGAFFYIFFEYMRDKLAKKIDIRVTGKKNHKNLTF